MFFLLLLFFLTFSSLLFKKVTKISLFLSSSPRSVTLAAGSSTEATSCVPLTLRYIYNYFFRFASRREKRRTLYAYTCVETAAARFSHCSSHCSLCLAPAPLIPFDCNQISFCARIAMTESIPIIQQ